MSVYLELCEILGISLNEFLAGEDIEVTNVEKKSEDTLIQISKDSSHKQRYLKKIIAILLIAVGVFAITLGIMVCNKLRQPLYFLLLWEYLLLLLESWYVINCGNHKII